MEEPTESAQLKQISALLAPEEEARRHVEWWRSRGFVFVFGLCFLFFVCFLCVFVCFFVCFSCFFGDFFHLVCFLIEDI